MADAKLGVGGRPNVGLPTRPVPDPAYTEEGRARRDGEGVVGGIGLVRPDPLLGTPDPVYFFWISVKEKMA